MTPALKRRVAAGTTRQLRKKITCLEAEYQLCLQKDEIFEVLKNIRNRIKAMSARIAANEPPVTAKLYD